MPIRPAPRSAALAASAQSRPGSFANGLRCPKRHSLGAILHRALSGWSGIDSKLPEVMVGPIDIRSHGVDKLEVHAQSH